ncbi:MAG: hypothetical protein LQ339_008981 [Xanthoria mediterranea]|nr:MAG: hypothetical protein LQ339_008981 [Xanthoria mediterranea]
MTLQRDLTINVSKFQPEAASDEVKNLNEYLMDTMKKGPKWYDVGAPKYRAMRANGETIFPRPIVLDRGRNISMPSREHGRNIPCRVMTPESGVEVKAVFMHIHGSGFVLSSEKEFDTVLAKITDLAHVVVVLVGYRLAPEDPFPAGPEDCFDAAEWLIDNAKEEFGVDLQFVGGESAGGHLALSTYFHLTTSRPTFNFSGLVLNYGVFDLSFLPQVYHFQKRDTLFLDKEVIEYYRDAFCPGMSMAQLRHPSVSPFYHGLQGLHLPPAMFTCGTEDCLLDDTVMMAARWQMNGGTAVVRILPGAPHAYTLFPGDKCPEAKEGIEAGCAFVREMTK